MHKCIQMWPSDWDKLSVYVHMYMCADLRGYAWPSYRYVHMYMCAHLCADLRGYICMTQLLRLAISVCSCLCQKWPCVHYMFVSSVYTLLKTDASSVTVALISVLRLDSKNNKRRNVTEHRKTQGNTYTTLTTQYKPLAVSTHKFAFWHTSHRR